MIDKIANRIAWKGTALLVLVSSILLIVIYSSTFIFAKKHQEKNYNYDHNRPKSCFGACIRQNPKCIDIYNEECTNIFNRCYAKCFTKPEKPEYQNKGVKTTKKKKMAPTPKKKKKFVKKAYISINKGVIANDEKKNKWYFVKNIYPKIKKAECGGCETFCHWDKRDAGGLTCGGVAIVHNGKAFVEAMNEFDECKNDYTGKLRCKSSLSLRRAMREIIYEKYAKVFAKCSRRAYPMLVDASVLLGSPRAIKLLQKVSGIKVDGLFGPQSLRACRNFDGEAYTKARIAQFKTFKKCSIYCKGWIKRAKEVLKEYRSFK